MTDETPRPKRRMKQPTNGAIRAELIATRAALAATRAALRGADKAVARLAGHADGLRAARQHDHDIARRVPRWVRRIFRA